MVWLVALFFIAPLAAAVVFWLSGHGWVAAGYYLAAISIPPLIYWLILESAVRAALRGDAMPIVFLAIGVGSITWTGLTLGGLAFASLLINESAEKEMQKPSP
jgi:hypothetical protein